MYFSEILGLFSPGHEVPLFPTRPLEPGALEAWSADELSVLIDEGRRQLDTQASRLDSVRTRAQIVLTTCIAVLALVAGGLRTIADAESICAFSLWSIGVAADVLAALGAAAVIVVRKDMGNIHATAVSQLEPPILQELAASYARTVRVGERTIAREVTVLRDAVLLSLVAVASYAISWALAVL